MRWKEFDIPLYTHEGNRETRNKRLRTHWRMRILFDRIRNNTSAEEAYSNLDSFEVSAQREQAGNASELFVKKIIEDAEDVVGVQRFPKLSHEDLTGLDLGVDLGGSYLINRMYVQVKSGRRETLRFKAETKGRYGLSDEEFEKWRLENRLIIIHSQMSPEKLRDEFEHQARTIDTYWGERDLDLFNTSEPQPTSHSESPRDELAEKLDKCREIIEAAEIELWPLTFDTAKLFEEPLDTQAYWIRDSMRYLRAGNVIDTTIVPRGRKSVFAVTGPALLVGLAYAEITKRHMKRVETPNTVEYRVDRKAALAEMKKRFLEG